jgi:hypothetical protein
MRRGRYARLYGWVWRDPAFLALSAGAVGVWAQMLAYSVDNDTAGRVPAAVVQLASRQDERLVTELEAAGMISRDVTGDASQSTSSPSLVTSAVTWSLARWSDEQSQRSQHPERAATSSTKTGAQRTAEWRARKAAVSAQNTAGADASDTHHTPPVTPCDVVTVHDVTSQVTRHVTQSDAAVIQSSSPNTHTPRESGLDASNPEHHAAIGVTSWMRALEKLGRKPTTVEPWRRQLTTLVGDLVRLYGAMAAREKLDRWLAAYLKAKSTVRPDWFCEWVSGELASGREPDSDRSAKSHSHGSRRGRQMPKPELVDWKAASEGPSARAAAELYGVTEDLEAAQ